MKLFCKSANQNKNNFRFTTLTKHVNNQTNCCIALEKLKKIWICLVFIQLYLVFSNQDVIRVEKSRVEMSFIGYLEVLLMALHPTSELSTMQWCVLIRFSPVRKSVLQYKLKVSKSRKKLWCSQFFQKTHYPEHLFFSKYAQDSEFRSFFGRIEKTMNCFQDLLTFSQK